MGLPKHIAITIGLLVPWAAPAAEAAEYCVRCVSPNVSYRCEVGTPQSPADPRAWLLCITELAKQGGHESCSVERNAPVPCEGVHKVLAAPEGEAPAAPAIEAGLPDPAAPAANEVEPGSPPPQKPPVKKPPQTVQELAGETLEASKEGLKSAGDTVSNSAKKAGEAVTGTVKSAGEKVGEAGSAVGNAAKKTWNCVTSLFQSC